MKKIVLLMVVLFLCLPAFAQDSRTYSNSLDRYNANRYTPVVPSVVRPYISANLGMTSTELDEGEGVKLKEDTMAYGASMGLSIHNRLRLEIAYQKREDMEKSETGWVPNYVIGPLPGSGIIPLTEAQIAAKVKSQMVLLNAFYDIYSAERVKIFVGVGGGVMFWDGSLSYQDVNESFHSSVKEKDPVFAAHAGLTLPLSDVVQLDLGVSYYRIFVKGGYDSIANKDVNNFMPNLAVRFVF